MTNIILNVDLINGTSEFVEVAAAPEAVAKPKMAIKNASKTSDEALIKKLHDHNVEVPEGSTRDELLSLARTNGLWNYGGNVVNPKFKQVYAANGGNCGDGLAKAFGQMTDTSECDAALANIASANDIDYGRWAHLNFGQRRMNLSNVLRGKIKRGEYVIVYNATTQTNTEWNDGSDDEAAEA